MRQQLDYLKRFLATTLGFVIFGVAGIFFKLVLRKYAKNYPNQPLATQLQGRKKVSQAWHFFVKYLIKTGVLEVHYSGFERLGRKGQLVLANHPSLLDVVLIFSQEPRFNCIVKQDLLKNPVMVDPIRACGFIPNTESEELLEISHNILQEQALLLFPEGTRTGWDGVVKLHRGAVSIGLRSAEVITPIKIIMSPLSLKKGHPWYKIPPQKIRYDLVVGEDIDPQTYLNEKPLPIASRRLNADLEKFFNE